MPVEDRLAARQPVATCKTEKLKQKPILACNRALALTSLKPGTRGGLLFQNNVLICDMWAEIERPAKGSNGLWLSGRMMQSSGLLWTSMRVLKPSRRAQIWTFRTSPRVR